MLLAGPSCTLLHVVRVRSCWFDAQHHAWLQSLSLQRVPSAAVRSKFRTNRSENICVSGESTSLLACLLAWGLNGGLRPEGQPLRRASVCRHGPLRG